MIRNIFLLATAIALSSSASAFVSPTFSRARSVSSSSVSALPEFLDGILGGSSPDAETLTPAVEAARAKFYFYFFAGSGAGGIGLAQLPTIFREAGVARSTAGTGSTLGGAALDVGPLVGIYYDSEISASDVANAIQKAPTAEFISSRSESINYMASKGYIEKRDFIKELEAAKCNPLAAHAVYDAISSGKGNVVSPVVYEEKLAKYRTEGGSAGEVAASFAGDLNGFLAVQVGAFFGLVFFLLVDIFFWLPAGIEGFL